MGHSILYVMEEVLLSEEGVIQGDSVAMPLNALKIIPLMNSVESGADVATQSWFADDAEAVGHFKELSGWFHAALEEREIYRHFANPKKSILWVADRTCLKQGNVKR
eukprot:GHVN01099678.1.p1 GENE.GHVN01099678.1~~GHVN01099678.1.p1  ORF type:complete len:107 (+),score=24.17 GHVN01099678.1:731-1051(+)